MDDPALDAEAYARVLADLAQVNTVTLARRPTLSFLKRAIKDRTSFSVLDVGFGDGDMLRAIARWAKREGKQARLVGIDLNSRSEQIARDATSSELNIDFRTGDYANLNGRQFDFVVSSLVAHHMSHQELVAFLRFMEREAVFGWFVNDLHRHSIAYVTYPFLARMARWDKIVRHDGKLSIARSFRPEEWLALLEEAGVVGASVKRKFPFRLCVEKYR